MLREVREETSLRVKSWRARGVVTFVSDIWETEYMHLFTADGFEGAPSDCDEGELAWVDKAQLGSLPLWEGDRIFLSLLSQDAPFFLLKLVYRGDTLVSAALDGKTL